MDKKKYKYEPSEFLKNNRNFLKNYCFKFEGLSPDDERGFTQIVKELGGKVSNEAKYTLVEKSYFEKEKNKKRKDLFHLCFILDSLNFGKILNIQLYRCDRTSDDNDDSDVDNIIRSESKDVLVKKHDIESDIESSSSNESVAIKPELNSTNNSDDDSNKMIKVEPKVEFSSSSSESNCEMPRAATAPLDEGSEPLTRKRKKKPLTKSSKRIWIDTNDLKNNTNNGNNYKKRNLVQNSAEERLSSVEERKDLKWLFRLDKNDLCSMENCKFEPGPHENHCLPGRVISDEEKKIILRFLIKNDLICKAKGSTVWKQMHDNGYLSHRSPETLRNCLRRVILPNINRYGLPKDILMQFMELERR